MSSNQISGVDACSEPSYGSDVIADLLRELGIKYLAINPGASFRGLHDSVVNRLGNVAPRLLLTLHEAQAVAIAHGYAKVTNEPMGVVLHANVGLMNAVMAIFDAYVDRVPMIVIGATGAVDAAKRRPWIEWVHSSRDQAALVRHFVKWDDQPASVNAALESFMRASTMTRTAPCAPVYICLDVTLQEDEIKGDAASLDPSRYAVPAEPTVSRADLDKIVEEFGRAKNPVILLGRHERSDAAWAARVALAEALGAKVICDQKCGVGFPSAHPLFVAAPAQYLGHSARKALIEADFILGLDWPDLGGTLTARPATTAPAFVVAVSPDERLHNGWSLDHFSLPETDVRFSMRPDVFVAELLALLPSKPRRASIEPRVAELNLSDGPITLSLLAGAFDRARGDTPVCITRLPFGWPEELTRFEGPLDCIGYDGGGGIGSTPGITVGAALALKGTGRIPVAILGDGDLLMGSQALWTAAAERLPGIFIVNNNRAFHNDVEHQEAVAIRRNRPVERGTIGMAIGDPPVDIAGLARASGLDAVGPIGDMATLEVELARAFERAREGATVLVDVLVEPPLPRS
jgi:thiamine pyrophosphate-dependent acetolactate synthase large subunit-like protein